MSNEKVNKTTKGIELAYTFRPFITHPPQLQKDVDETIVDMGRAIDKLMETTPPIEARVRQLLSALEYEKLTDFQAKIVLLLEQELKNNNQ